VNVVKHAGVTVALLIGSLTLAIQAAQQVPRLLPAPAVANLSKSLEAAQRHRSHVWRDVTPFDDRGLVNAYIEISRGDRRKWEFDMRANARAIDRVVSERIGGFPVNYGFVPQTVSYDGDPFDALVLGPPLEGARLVQGVIVGLMQMDDEKGLDSKVVLARVGGDGRPLHQLTDADRNRIAAFFRNYKTEEPGKFSRVPGWGSIEDGRTFITTTHAFFKQCRSTAAPCQVDMP
jgi:inorganic pyrophosphatase